MESATSTKRNGGYHEAVSRDLREGEVMNWRFINKIKSIKTGRPMTEQLRRGYGEGRSTKINGGGQEAVSINLREGEVMDRRKKSNDFVTITT